MADHYELGIPMLFIIQLHKGVTHLLAYPGFLRQASELR